MTESRRFPHVMLSVPEFAKYAGPLFPGKQVRDITLLADGLCNTNYSFKIDGLDDKFVLRLYIRDESAGALEQQIELRTRGKLPIPEFLFADFSARSVPHPYAIIRFVRGVSMREALKSDRDDSSAISKVAGGILADISKIELPAAGRLTELWEIEPWPWGNDPNLDSVSRFILWKLEHPIVSRRLGEARKERLRRFIHANHQCMKAVEHRANLVHGDFNRSNLVLKKTGDEWSVAAVLDWEWAHSGSTMMDIGNMLRDIGYLAPAFEGKFIEGFVEGGGWLPEQWKKISMYVDMSNHCEFLESRNEGNEFIPGCLRSIDTTMDNWERY